MLTRAKTVDWENVADLIPHSENSKFVSVDGARVHYQEFGDASKPTIVMIHGYTASLYVWKTVAPMLADAGFISSLSICSDSDIPTNLRGSITRSRRRREWSRVL
jgi:hypothetical protein